MRAPRAFLEAAKNEQDAVPKDEKQAAATAIEGNKVMKPQPQPQPPANKASQ